GIAAQLVGLAQGALEVALDHAAHREQFGHRIGDFQGVRFPLARLTADVEAARVLLYNTTRAVQHGSTDRLQSTAMAKLVASEIAERVASHAVETLGGIGFTKQKPAEKFYRDAKIGKIYEGTTNVQLRTISATLLR
ncbi:MAG TPA: acyl-CoA dehydrogenase family protein, partial [Pseudonocardiaceae bacterium]|nr:acyl-CoA dehydrogenase family protein [Pseudonocardiaceae bacterium]